MATVTTKLDAAMNAIADGLALRAGLSGVQVGTGPLGAASQQESIQLFTGSSSQEWATTGRRKEEELTIDGSIWVSRPSADDAVIREARARAIALLAELEDFLRLDPSLGGVVRVSSLASVELDQGVTPDGGRWCQLDFVIECNQRLNA